MCTSRTDKTVSLRTISENLSSELRIILDDVFELQRAFLNPDLGPSEKYEYVLIAQKFDFVEQGICDMQKVLENFCNSYERAALHALSHNKSSASARSSSLSPPSDNRTTRRLLPSDGTPPQPRFDTSVLVADLNLGRIKERFLSRSVSRGDKRGTDEVEWL